jgi:tripartite-type tricarboxylate transporter receptor subunit TctC
MASVRPRICVLAAFTLVLAFCAASVSAQTLSKNARIVLGFTPGGSADTVARMVADHLRGVYAPNVIVENRPGGGGRTVVEHVKASEADGSTILLTPRAMLTIFPHLYKTLGYDPFSDFTPVTAAAGYAYAIVAGPALPDEVRTLPEFLKWAKANPKGAAFASPGPGTAPHFVGVMLARASGVNLTHVPYKGALPAVQDLLGGQVPVGIVPTSDTLPHVRAGKFRVFATTGPQRSRFLKDAPTAKELGFKQVDAEESFVIVVSSKVPARVADRLGTLIRAGQQSQAAQERLAQLGIEAQSSTTEELTKWLKADYERWGPIVKASGFKAED